MDVNKAQEYFTNKMNFTTGSIELDGMIKQQSNNVHVVDVRFAEDYAKGHIPGAINLPKDQWDDAKELSKEKTNIIYCYSQTCHLAAEAALEFAKKGYPVMELEGGFKTWSDNQLNIEK